MRFWETKPLATRPQVGVVVATYHQGPKLECLLASFLAQTYNRWTMHLVHDGPWKEKPQLTSEQIILHETPKREQVFGHNCRELGRKAFAELPEAVRPKYLMFTNGDNYYVPVFLEAMLWGIQSQKADLAYSNMVHSHKKWSPLKTQLRRGHVDMGCWVCRADWIYKQPFSGREFASDWFYLEKILARSPRVAKVDPYLVVHN